MRCIGLIVILAAALAAGLCGCTKKSDAAAEKKQPTLSVTAAKALMQTVPVELSNLNGTVGAYATVNVKSQVAGTLEKINFVEGQYVQEGSPLMMIDPRPWEAALKLAKANVEKDKAQLANAERDAKRQTELLAKGVASQNDYDTSITARETFRATLEADIAAVEAAALKVEFCSITAPVSGTIGSMLINAGNVIKENDVPIVALNQIKPIYVAFSVPQKYLADIQDANSTGPLAVTAKVFSEQDITRQGKLVFIDNAVDTQTGTIRLKAQFDNNDMKLWPGQFVYASLTLRSEPNVITIPSQAINNSQQGQFVFVIKPDMTVESRPVTQERSWDGVTAISKGINAGETVVTDGQLRLINGSKVEIVKGVSESEAEHK
jgi:multidrug efflux system membrane fusion protein